MNRRELLVFEVGARTFALPLGLVEEVVPAGLVTSLPKAPSYLTGLTAVRGKVMGVIDLAKRYGLGPSLGNHFVVCRVRGNLTALAVERPVTAGSLAVRELDAAEREGLRARAGLAPEFVTGGFALLQEEEGRTTPTGIEALVLDADLFAEDERKVGGA